MCYFLYSKFPLIIIFGIFLLKYREKSPKIIYNSNMVQKNIKRIVTILLIAFFMCVPFLYSYEYSDFYDSLADAFGGFVDPNAGNTIFTTLTAPLGGRSEAMGAAYTAVADDLAFLNHNPAISAVLPTTQLALYHNFWIADSAIDTIAFSQRNGDFGYGTSLKSFYVPFTEYGLTGEKLSRGYYSETIGTLNLSYNLFSGYHFKGLAFGVNFKFGYRGVPDFADSTTNQVVVNSGLAQSAVAVMGDAGILMRFDFGRFYNSREPNFNIGISALNFGVAWTGFTHRVVMDDALPATINIGISYRAIAPLLISLDAQKPINVFDYSKSEAFSFGVGVEGIITDFVSIQGGFLVKGGNPKISLGSQLIWNELTFNVTYSLDLTSSLSPFNKISLSAKLDFGDRGRAEILSQVDALYMEGLNLYVEGQFVEAIAIWEEARVLFPGFDPVLDGLKAARQAIELRTTIEDVQSLDVVP